MKTVQSLLSIGLGFVIAWTILTFTPRPKVSMYSRQMDAWPLELDDSNLALIGVGLASPKPKTSVMDATPAPMAKPVMMAPGPSPVSMSPGPVSTSPGPGPSPMSMSPGPGPSPVSMSPAPGPSPSS